MEGELLGEALGAVLGVAEGEPEGLLLGSRLGLLDGPFDGLVLGAFEGEEEGLWLGASDGVRLGCMDGDRLIRVGASEGDWLPVGREDWLAPLPLPLLADFLACHSRVAGCERDHWLPLHQDLEFSSSWGSASPTLIGWSS